MAKKASAPAAPKSDIRRLESTLEQIEHRLASQTRWRPVLLRAFASGICTALGALAAVAVVVPITVWFLRGVHWPPLLDAMVDRVLTRIDQSEHRQNSSSFSSSSSSSVPTVFPSEQGN
jgi:hypothetical protein